MWHGVSTLLFFALFVLCVRAYFFQTLDLSGQTERVLRAQIAPQLEKALGAKVEFGEVETDWLGRVVIRQIVIGRDAKLPTGALFQAQSAILNLDLPGIALGRAAFPGAIRSVELQNPQIYLRRDARGLNWANLLQKSGGAAQTPAWSGQISATGGRIYYLDTTITSASKQPFLLDARGVDARLDAQQNAPYRFAARAQTPLLGAQKLQLDPISGNGSLETDAKNGLLSLETGALPFAPLADYAFPKREVVARAGGNGSLGGRVIFSMTRGVLAQHGALSLRNLSFSVPSFKEPGTARALQIDALSGPFEFAGEAFSTPGARFSALGTAFQVAGAASTSGAQPFDLDIQTRALPIAALRPYLPRGVSFSSAAAPLGAHLSGNASGQNRQIDARGTLETPAVRLASVPNNARAAFGTLKTDFAALANLRPDNSFSDWKIAARGWAPTSQIALAEGGFVSQNTFFTLRAARDAGLEIGVNARSFRAISPRFGGSNGQNLQLVASAPDALRPLWNGSFRVQNAATNGVKWGALSPSLARSIASSGALDVEAQFSGLDAALDTRKLRGAATFALASLQLDPRAFASQRDLPLQNADFSLRALRGRVAFADGIVDLSRAAAISSLGALRLDASVPLQNPNAARLALSLPDASVDVARLAPFLRAQNIGLGGNWRGRVTLLSRAATAKNAPPRFGLDFDLRAPSSVLRGAESRAGAVVLNAPNLQGRAEFPASGADSNWSGSGVLRAQSASFQGGSLGQLAAIPAELSGARARDLRLDFALQNGASSNRASLAARAFDVPLPVAAQNPRAGQFLRLENLSADLENGRDGTVIPRFVARFGRGDLRGTARLTARGPRAQVLARGVDVARLQDLLSPDSRRAARVSGLASALIEVRPQGAVRAQIRLAGGAVRVVSASKTQLFPLQNARATVFIAQAGQVQIRDALVWSEGARLAANATLRGSQWSGQLEVSGARLAKLAALPLAPQMAQNARPDGIAGGKFDFAFDTRRQEFSRLSGSANLRLAEVFGAQIDALSGQISLQNPRGNAPRLAIAALKGEIEGATLSGEASADFGRNLWSVDAKWSELQSARLARLQVLQNAPGSAPRAVVLGRALPIQGDLGGQVQLTGTLQNARGEFAPRARDGVVRLASGELVWRGRAFGALNADVSVENGIARARTLQLMQTQGGKSTPLVQISGVLPLDADAPGLDAQVRVAAAPLAFFTGALSESRDALRNSDLAIPFFERVVAYVDALPRGTTGLVALEANLSGKWSAPRVAVSNLTLREGRTRIPAGGFSPPATLDAAFVFERGAVTIEKAEFKIKKSAAAPVFQSNRTASASEEEDTLLRVEPGGTATPDGPISLAADVFNANLSQLSTWVPALRARDGGPLLRGELSEFSFRVGGTTVDPAITGSIQGENLALEDYTLDRLRVSRFEIAGGAARIEPGNLTLVKGAFQSSAAYGTVPWSWELPGPVLDGPIDVHFPLQTRDFGALVGAFVPALSVADADEFNGSVDVAGTLSSPALSGAITIRGGQFRLDATRNPLAAGLQNVSGTVRFVGATQILIDEADPLRGKLVPANLVVGRAARSVETGKIGATTPATAPVVAAGPIAKTSKNGEIGVTQLAGEFVLRGGVVRPAQIDALLDIPSELPSNAALSDDERRTNAARLRALLDPAAALSRLKYDLSLEFDKGAFASDAFGGVSDVSAGLIWKTGENEAQNVRWMIAARGQKARKLKNGGALTSFGSLALPRNFGAGIDAIARSGARDFGGEGDFSRFAVAKRVDVAKAPDRRAQVDFDDFAASVTGAGSGVVNGRLVLDNRAAQQKAPPGAARLQNASLRVQSRRALFGPQWERDFALSPRFNEIQDGNSDSISPADDVSSGDGAPLRLGGVLTLSSAEIYGAPAGGEGAALLLSRLPGAPRFDIRLRMGRDVQVVTAAFRAGLEGEMVAQGTPNDPQILGVLNTRGGQVRFPNARARVDEGRVTVSLSKDEATDTLRTRLDIDATARGQAGRYAITLRLRGPLDLSGVPSGAGDAQSLQIEVTSNPPLSQSEAFQQLLGTMPDLDYDEKTGTYKVGSVNRAYTNAVLNVISAPLFSGVEQSLAQTLGLTSVGFEYRFNEPLAVQITKALGDRVFVSYRRSLGSGPTGSIASSLSSGRTPFELRIEYRLRGNYLLGLQTDERQIPSITLQRTRRF